MAGRWMVLPIHHRHTAQKRQRTIDRPPRPRPRRLEGAEAHPRRLSSSIPTRSGTRRASHLALQRRTALSGPRHRSWRRVPSSSPPLARMASFLKITMGEIDIRNGGYAPQGWAYRDERDSELKDLALDIVKGKQLFPIITTIVPLPSQT